MLRFVFAIYTLATLAVGVHLTDGGGHTDPPDVDGIFALTIMSGDDGSLSDPPDVDGFA